MTRLVPFIATLAACLLPLVSSAQDLEIRAAEVTGFGIIEAAGAQRTAGFRRTAVDADKLNSVRIVEYTNEIPGVLGTDFGFHYKINSVPRGAKVEVTNVIRFPEGGLHRPNGRVYTESRETQRIELGQQHFYGYGFDSEWEIVPGEWVFEVWLGEARLIRRSFNVVIPEDDAGES